MVYLHRERPEAIVATKFKDEFYYESDDAISTCDTTSDITLGEVVRDRFMESNHRPGPAKGKNPKRSDWPAYKASGLKSVARFERDYIAVSVHGANEAIIIVRLESAPVQWGIMLTTHCNPLAAEKLGGEIKKICENFLKWEKV